MGAYTLQELEALWVKAGGSQVYAPMAAAVALAESGGNPGASNRNKNGSVDRGLWQVNSIHGGLSTFDPLANARAAVSISTGGTNWRPWCAAWSTGLCSGSYLGKGAPVLDHLPAGANTGVVPSGTASAYTVTPALKAIAVAYSEIGKPYKYGDEGPNTFDCSGLIQFIYKGAGVTLPRTAKEQQKATTRISRAELRPGDLVFWGNPAHHVALYIGGGRIIQAPQTGELVDNVPLWGTPTNFGRVRGSGAQGGTDTTVTKAQASSGLVETGFDLPNPFTAPGDWVQSFINFFESAGAIMIGLTLFSAGVILAILSTKSAEDKGREAIGIIGAAKGRSAPAPTVSRQPAPQPITRPVPPVRGRRVDRTSVTSGERPAISGGSRPEGKVIDGEVVG